jgi:hypothetical protein
LVVGGSDAAAWAPWAARFRACHRLVGLILGTSLPALHHCASVLHMQELLITASFAQSPRCLFHQITFSNLSSQNSARYRPAMLLLQKVLNSLFAQFLCVIAALHLQSLDAHSTEIVLFLLTPLRAKSKVQGVNCARLPSALPATHACNPQSAPASLTIQLSSGIARLLLLLEKFSVTASGVHEKWWCVAVPCLC